MARYFKYIFVILIIALAGCQIQQARLRTHMSEQELSRHLDELQAFRINHVALDYMARGKIRIKTPEETVSGSCRITISNQQELRIEVFSPLGGMVMAIYMDQDIIQLLLRSKKVFYQMENNDANRRKRLQFIDLTVGELQEVLWGRKIISNQTNLKFQWEGDKPLKIESADMVHKIGIYYKNWFDYKGVLFPKTIYIRDSQRQISIKLVVTELSLGYSEQLKINNIPPDYELKS